MTLTVSTSGTPNPPFVQFNRSSTQKIPKFYFPSNCTISLPSGYTFLSGSIDVLYCARVGTYSDTYAWPYIGYSGTISSETNTFNMGTTYSSPTTFNYDSDFTFSNNDVLYNEVWLTDVYVRAPNGDILYLNNANPRDWWYIHYPTMTSPAWSGELHYFDSTWTYTFDDEEFLKTRYTSDLIANGVNVSVPLNANGTNVYRLQVKGKNVNDLPIDIFHKYQTIGSLFSIQSELNSASSGPIYAECITGGGTNPTLTLKFYGPNTMNIVLTNGCKFLRCDEAIFRTSFYCPNADRYWVADYSGSIFYQNKVQCTKQGGNPVTVWQFVINLSEPCFFYTEVFFTNTVVQTAEGIEVTLAGSTQVQYRISANEAHYGSMTELNGVTYEYLNQNNSPHTEYTKLVDDEVRVY